MAIFSSKAPHWSAEGVRPSSNSSYFYCCPFACIGVNDKALSDKHPAHIPPLARMEHVLYVSPFSSTCAAHVEAPLCSISPFSSHWAEMPGLLPAFTQFLRPPVTSQTPPFNSSHTSIILTSNASFPRQSRGSFLKRRYDPFVC